MGPQTAAKNKEFNMYYDDIVPGFKTITLVEQGYFDSLGNAGRYAAGDVQWH